MIQNFEEMKQQLKNQAPKTLAVVVAQDEEVLMAVAQAAQERLTKPILIGNRTEIEKIARDHKISIEGMEIIEESDHLKAAQKGCELVREGRAHAIMKGLLDTSYFMKAILNKERGLNTGKLLSHVAVYELERYPKLLLLTDAAINIAPDLDQKVQIINNSVAIARKLQIENPLVAICCAVEKVNPGMPATMEAAALTQMNRRGQISNCVVDGPLGFDNAISEESAKIKKITSPVAGRADIIMGNTLESSNFLYKSLNFMANCKAGAIVAGAQAPVVLTSRADSHENKFLSIVLALATSL